MNVVCGVGDANNIVLRAVLMQTNYKQTIPQFLVVWVLIRVLLFMECPHLCVRQNSWWTSCRPLFLRIYCSLMCGVTWTVFGGGVWFLRRCRVRGLTAYLERVVFLQVLCLKSGGGGVTRYRRL
ncbi:uncharacterized protein TM35_000651210 [Trypanosoma theileri]|uniref:Uncharacterized protein n=1 Tax=Trypanosoma theileri TaxID=67003 RepID=A0A1X0NHA0_9TRYP|nr:uncharacterized protein TM35_000651210 [Trypanosoma theileri]ORC83559.1 hypothetical protein TM35_000651210 [Trypanosoma theileri]